MAFVSVPFAFAVKPDNVPISVVMTLPPPESPDQLLEPIGQLRIAPPETSNGEARDYEELLELGRADEGNEQAEGDIEEQQPEPEPEDQCEQSPTHRNLWLGRRHLPAPALGTDLRPARILVQARAEFHVVAPAAVVAEERFSGCHVSALVAIRSEERRVGKEPGLRLPTY